MMQKLGRMKNRSRHTFKTCLLLVLLFLPLEKAMAQSIPVGDFLESQFRVLQLLSDSTTQLSFSNRPVSRASYDALFESSGLDGQSLWTESHGRKAYDVSIRNYTLTLGSYDPEILNTYNDELPYGENNGSAWYGKGLNTEFKAGFYVTSKYLSATFRPHFSYQENADFRTPRFIPKYPDGSDRYVAQGILPEDTLADRIDRPFRFGPDSYSTFDLGHSSIRLHYQNVEVGLSKEPLWWGPGVQYALMMSNNAPGLKHAFMGSREPIPLPFNAGHLEFRLIGAWPEDSKYFDLNLDISPHKEILADRYLRDRFMNGLNLIYSPSFIPNFHVGLSRVVHQYIPDTGLRFEDYFQAFAPFPKPDERVLDTFRDESYFEDKNHLSSIYFRWVFPESNAEVYGEYMKNNQSFNFRDLLMEPQHGRAYTFGFQKIIESNWIDFFKINAEFNSLLPGEIDDVRPQTYYYTHQSVKQGHTNGGQLLGAAIGPGSTSQYLGADAYHKKGSVGFFIQRMVDNDLFHFEYYQRFFTQGGFKDQFRHRANLNIGLKSSYLFRDILFSGRFVWNKNFSYGRFNYGEFPINYETREGTDVINLQFQLSARYLF